MNFQRWMAWFVVVITCTTFFVGILRVDLGCSKVEQQPQKEEPPPKPKEWVTSETRYENIIRIQNIVVPGSMNRRFKLHYMDGNQLKQVRFNGPNEEYKIICDVPEDKPIWAMIVWNTNKNQPGDYFISRYEIHVHKPDEILSAEVISE